MNALVTQMHNVRSEQFHCANLRLHGGEVGVVCVKSLEQGMAFVDAMMGLKAPMEGRVELLGTLLYELPESARLSLLARTCHVGGGLVSNLKVWENLALPALFHHLISAEEVERRLVAAMEQIQNKDDWLQNRLKALPDTLSTYSRRMVGLLRCAIQRPQLIVAEFLLDDLEEGPVDKLVKMLVWLKSQAPDMAVLLVNLGPIDAGHLALQNLKAAWIVELEEPHHAVSEKH